MEKQESIKENNSYYDIITDNQNINNQNNIEDPHQNNIIKQEENKENPDNENKIISEEDKINQEGQKDEEEKLIVNDLNNNEDDKQKQSPDSNSIERYNSEFSNLEEKQETLKIIGDVDMKNTSTNNLYYLGNLFRDVVNKFDMENENMQETRKLIRKTISKKNKLNDNLIKEQQSFNFNDIINVQLNEVKQNTLSYLEKARSELDKRYTSYIQKINDYINENELKISKVFTNFETNENFMNYADDTIFKQIDYLLEIHENIFSALEDHINLLFTFLDQISLIKQKNPFEHFLNTNSNEILNCWFLSKINFNKLSLSNVIINKDLSDLVSGYLCKKRENNFAKITIQKDTKGNLSLESEFLRDNINNLEKLKFFGLSGDSVNDILKNLNKKSANKKKAIDENIQIGKKLHSLSIIETNFCHNELPKFSLPILRKAKIKKSLFSH